MQSVIVTSKTFLENESSVIKLLTNYSKLQRRITKIPTNSGESKHVVSDNAVSDPVQLAPAIQSSKGEAPEIFAIRSVLETAQAGITLPSLYNPINMHGHLVCCTEFSDSTILLLRETQRLWPHRMAWLTLHGCEVRDISLYELMPSAYVEPAAITCVSIGSASSFQPLDAKLLGACSHSRMNLLQQPLPKLGQPNQDLSETMNKTLQALSTDPMYSEKIAHKLTAELLYPVLQQTTTNANARELMVEIFVINRVNSPGSKRLPELTISARHVVEGEAAPRDAPVITINEGHFQVFVPVVGHLLVDIVLVNPTSPTLNASISGCPIILDRHCHLVTHLIS